MQLDLHQGLRCKLEGGRNGVDFSLNLFPIPAIQHWIQWVTYSYDIYGYLIIMPNYQTHFGWAPRCAIIIILISQTGLVSARNRSVNNWICSMLIPLYVRRTYLKNQQIHFQNPHYTGFVAPFPKPPLHRICRSISETPTTQDLSLHFRNPHYTGFVAPFPKPPLHRICRSISETPTTQDLSLHFRNPHYTGFVAPFPKPPLHRICRSISKTPTTQDLSLHFRNPHYTGFVAPFPKPPLHRICRSISKTPTTQDLSLHFRNPHYTGFVAPFPKPPLHRICRSKYHKYQ